MTQVNKSLYEYNQEYTTREVDKIQIQIGGLITSGRTNMKQLTELHNIWQKLESIKEAD